MLRDQIFGILGKSSCLHSAARSERDCRIVDGGTSAGRERAGCGSTACVLRIRKRVCKRVSVEKHGTNRLMTGLIERRNGNFKRLQALLTMAESNAKRKGKGSGKGKQVSLEAKRRGRNDCFQPLQVAEPKCVRW